MMNAKWEMFEEEISSVTAWNGATCDVPDILKNKT